ncbi:aminoacyl-tRNA hydrolase [Candidatus Williamhamiltonella defendens]|uniref:Peptidyl-tRNA hydrolase n=1 Tax=Candidatus Hamiltonella defensa (Bemisia tabaci) TaxID=672795 RepID=A0A249DW92_9ENTR|nr:aminoacyl-tRNA hydrolase [Candidatus Hamiltonella defensa]ASX25816.1 aminoacyl-tRNA hydrolase [Candidatus Hamiltonella defensa (Bemisia tabaci)]CED78597.1 Peptidyl-tRNA hydrolase [Candidatus Hamiltonella defensa (Bemisia tabaci)]
MSNIKLIVGLANPTAEYSQTRHNAGAWYVKQLSERHNLSLKKSPKFFGYTGRLKIANQNVLLMIPDVFMNLSGTAVFAITKFYQILPEELLVAHDELDFLPGQAKFKTGGGNAGHNGLKDIQKKLGNNSEFHRLRIGIGHPGDTSKVVDFVLGKPPVREKKLIDHAIDECLTFTEILFKENMIKAVHHLHSSSLNKK